VKSENDLLLAVWQDCLVASC